MNRSCHVYIIHSTIKSVASVSAPASSSKTPPLPSGVASIGQLMVVCITTHADMNWACHAYTIQSTIKSIASMSASVSSSKTPPLAGGRVSSIGQARVVCIWTHTYTNWPCHRCMMRLVKHSVASSSAAITTGKTPPIAGSCASIPCVVILHTRQCACSHRLCNGHTMRTVASSDGMDASPAGLRRSSSVRGCASLAHVLMYCIHGCMRM